MLASSYCSRKASTSNRQSVYITSTPGSVDLKISISNLAGTSCFFYLLPLQPLHLYRQPTVSLMVEYPSEFGAPLSGEEGGEPPLPTTVHWDLGGHLHGCAAPVWEVSLASAIPSTVVALPTCWGALPTSCTEESDSPAFMTGIPWTGFSARLLSLRWSEAATARCHTSIRGKRLMVKWAKHKIHSEKASSTWARITCGILAQAPTALLVIKEQIGSAWDIHLHMFQLPKDQVTLWYVHDHPRIPGEHRRMGPTRAVSHHHL